MLSYFERGTRGRFRRGNEADRTRESAHEVLNHQRDHRPLSPARHPAGARNVDVVRTARSTKFGLDGPIKTLFRQTKASSEEGDMDFGIFYEIQVNSPLKHREREAEVFHQVLEQVALAEEAGFGNFWSVEHHFQPGFSHCSAPEVLYGALSQRTSKIRIGHAVVLLPFPYNHPVRVAERIATLDILSKGRVEVGTGRSATIQELGGAEFHLRKPARAGEKGCGFWSTSGRAKMGSLRGKGAISTYPSERSCRCRYK